ncbi:MAG: hypothetical protein JW936_02940 [Sedimentisphaerales bacterium]|nr:hypothetical protein [Sedimentisphaerales bacterium]
MFTVINIEAKQAVKTPSGDPLHQQYEYLRLFFGRYLANVRCDQSGAFQYLIPQGVIQDKKPEPERIRQELAGLEWTLKRALREIQDPQYARSAGRVQLRRTMSSILAECRIAGSAHDVCFDQNGNLLLLNWCTADSPNTQKLAECDPRDVIAKLAYAFQVQPPPPIDEARLHTAAPHAKTAAPPQTLIDPSTTPFGSDNAQKARGNKSHLVTVIFLMALAVAAFIVGHYIGHKRDAVTNNNGALQIRDLQTQLDNTVQERDAARQLIEQLRRQPNNNQTSNNTPPNQNAASITQLIGTIDGDSTRAALLYNQQTPSLTLWLPLRSNPLQNGFNIVRPAATGQSQWWLVHETQISTESNQLLDSVTFNYPNAQHTQTATTAYTRLW